MKVLKSGLENNKLETIEISCTGVGFSDCKGCGALLEVNGLDIKSGVSHDYGGGSDTYYYIICPVCGAKTEVYYSQLSNQMKSMLW